MKFNLISIFFICISVINAEANEFSKIQDKVSNWLKEKFNSFEKEVMIQYGLYEYQSKEWKELREPFKHKNALLLIHGLDDPGILWDELAEKLIKFKSLVLRLSYPNDQAISKSTAYLNQQLIELKSQGVDKVVLIAHSMGGLIARDVITNRKYFNGMIEGGNLRPSITKLITIGTPNQGSNFAHLQFISELGEQFVHLIRDEARFLGFFYDGFGEAGKDLLPGSDYLDDLNSRIIPENLDMTIIAGNMSLDSSKKLEEHVFEWGKQSRFKNEIKQLENYFKKSTELLGDGVVTLESAKIKGVSDFVIVQGNHISMLTTLSIKTFEPGSFPIIIDRLKSIGIRDVVD